MMSKFEIEKQAKQLIETDPAAAVEIYRKLWSEFQENFNVWDAFFSIKALRKALISDFDWARTLVDKFEDEKVSGLFAWLVFDICIKNCEREKIIGFEELLLSLIVVSPQKNVKRDSTYPCPTTISIFKLIDAHSENQFNAVRINDLLGLLNVSYLSDAPQIRKTEEKGDVESASDFEKYYALKTKALLKLKEYSACKSLCEEALTVIDKLHHDNDLWFRMRIAICNEHLGNIEKSKEQFESILATREGGDKWFIYKELSGLYYEQGIYVSAWKYAIIAALLGNEPKFMNDLYLLQTKILYNLGRQEEGKILAELIASVIKEQHWKIKDKYARLLKYYKIDTKALEDTGKYLKKAQDFWIKERYRGVPKTIGQIVFVHNNGKVGKIEDSQGKAVGFHRKHFTKKPQNIADLKGATVEFYAMPSFDGSLTAENIVVTSPAKKMLGHENIGKIYNGTVKNIVEFGIFVAIDGESDGLLYKGKIPPGIRNTFHELFKPGDPIKVEVIAVTEKGMQFRLVH